MFHLSLAELISSLSQSQAYPYPVKNIQVHQTHNSVVFLAGPFAYKIKKPVQLEFLDFSTLEKRLFYCQEEVRLNRRLAPTVYLGVVPIGAEKNGPQLEGSGPVLEWAVKMLCLPEQATLEKRLLRGEVTPIHMDTLAARVANFHRQAENQPRISQFGNLDNVARNIRENFGQCQAQIGLTVSPAVFQRVQDLTEECLGRLGPLIQARAERGVPRDTHGDLRLDHVYQLPGEESNQVDQWLIIDCIEFNERFRYADPVADMAFLVMDLAYHGRRDLGRRFAESYFQAAGDEEGRALLSFYSAYRAVVRAKVEGMEITEKGIGASEREVALARVQTLWLLALEELETPGQKG